METQQSDTNVESLLELIKEQNKEIKMNKKKLEKLEERFIKTNADFKNVLNDKMQMEIFLKNIFPKDLHDSVFKKETEYGLYNTNELSKYWIVQESKNQNEFSNIVDKMKNENRELSEKLRVVMRELDIKTNELNGCKESFTKSKEQLLFYEENFHSIAKKVEGYEEEKHYLMKLIDEKNSEIEKLICLEVENAELKAKSLLENLESNYSNTSSTNKKTSYLSQSNKEDNTTNTGNNNIKIG